MSIEELLTRLKELRTELSELKEKEIKVTAELSENEKEYVKTYCPFKVGDVVDIVADFRSIRQRRTYKVGIKQIARKNPYIGSSCIGREFGGNMLLLNSKKTEHLQPERNISGEI